MDKIYDEIYAAKVKLDNAKLSGNWVLAMRTRLSNILLNNVDGILEGLREANESTKKIASMERDVESLQAALLEADAAAKNTPAAKGKSKHGDAAD